MIALEFNGMTSSHRSFEMLAEDIFEFVVPALSLWWEARYRIALRCFGLTEKMAAAKDMNELEELKEKYEQELMPFSNESTRQDMALCSYVKLEYYVAESEAMKNLGIAKKED